MKSIAIIFTILLLSCCATHERSKSYSQLYADNLLTVPDDANWTLIGEWDYPGKGDGFMNFTMSIVHFNGNYIEVNSGQVVSGCCYWPQGTRLKQIDKDTFISQVNGDSYSINPDGSLLISRKNGTVVIANKTGAEDSLSRHWH